MRYPTTKQEASDLDSEQISWGAEPALGKLLYDYLIDIGAKHELPKDKNELVKYINQLHRKLTIGNYHFPNDIPFEIIYPAFISAVLNEHVEIPEYQPHATKSQLSAFKKWITKGGQMDSLYQKHFHRNPDKQPKRLSRGSSGDLERWSDNDIMDQYRKIRLVMGEEVPILNTINAKSYFERINDEVNNRGLLKN